MAYTHNSILPVAPPQHSTVPREQTRAHQTTDNRKSHARLEQATHNAGFAFDVVKFFLADLTVVRTFSLLGEKREGVVFSRPLGALRAA